MAKIYPFISPITFNSAIRQTLTPPNLPAIRHIGTSDNRMCLNCYPINAMAGYQDKLPYGKSLTVKRLI